VLIIGVVKLVPVPKEAPPVEVAYQLMVPAAVVACKVTVPDTHTEAPVVLAIVGIAFIVATTAVLVADTQPVLVFRAAT
jgi:hypothetical protein